jgi:uncharacterized protein YebE (UPF0316 family)
MIDVSFQDPWVLPLVIFGLRVLGIGLDTVRMLFVIRGRKLYVWLLGFTETALWVLAISGVLSNLDNLWNMLAYAAGFATGNVVGMMVEERMAVGYVELQAMSPARGSAIVEGIRSLGHAATEFSARDKDGAVAMIQCCVLRRNMDVLYREIRAIDPQVFITIAEIHPLHRGYWRIKSR